MITQVTWSLSAVGVLWAVTVLGVLVCGLLFLAFRDPAAGDRRQLLPVSKEAGHHRHDKERP